MTVATEPVTVTVTDIDYLRHGDRALQLRLFAPPGDGPFAAVVELHAGAWRNGDRTTEHHRHWALAQAGFVVAALDFRQGRDGAYPGSVADINYGIRWVKAHAGELKIEARRIGLSGQSSGGHLAMLAAMRPHDPRYAALALPAGLPACDASVRCVAMSWPVINPLSRYRHAVAERERASWPADIIEAHHDYWQSEANMAEGNPLLALERGEPVLTPPALWLQTRNDTHHDYRDPQGSFDGNEPARFVADYRRAGGTIELVYFDAPARFTTVEPTSPQARDAFARLAAFFTTHLAHG